MTHPELHRCLTHLYLTHQKKHLGDGRLFQSLFAQLKSFYPDHRAIYTDGSKTEKRVAAAVTSNNLSAHVRLPGNASIFTAELQALKLVPILLKIVMGIILSYSLILYLVYKLLITTTVIILLFKIFENFLMGNEKADELVKQTLNFNVLDLKVPYTDLKVNVNSVLNKSGKLNGICVLITNYSKQTLLL